MAGLENLEERGLAQAVRNHGRDRHPYRPNKLAIGRYQMALQRVDRLLYVLQLRQQFFTEFSKAIATGMPRRQLPTDTQLQLGYPSMDGRLTHSQSSSCSQGAAGARDGQRKPQVVPVKL